MNKIYITMLTLIANIAFLQGQNIINLQLKNTEQQPLIGATYKYGEQSGITDHDGQFTLTYVKGNSLILSYLGYGQWELEDGEILSAAETGVIYRKIITNSLQPVTVISLRNKESETQNQVFNYQDKVHHDGGALLTQSPAISGIRKGGGYGLDPVMRGFKYDQINVVMNGTQCATAACPNRMDPPTSQMAPNMLDRVEILKGPHALRYGGGLGATINYITESPSFNDTPSLFGRVSGKYDNNGEVYKTEAKVGVKGSFYNLALFGSYADGSDYKTGNAQTVQSDFNRMSFGTQLGIKLTSNQTLNLAVFNNRAKDTDFPSLRMDLRSDNTLMVNAGHTINLNNNALKSWSTTVFLSNVDHLMDNGLKPLDPRMMNASNNAKTQNLGGRTEGVWNFNNNKLYLGADFKMEEAEGKRNREFLLGPNSGKIFMDNAWQHGFINKVGIFTEYNTKILGWKGVLAARIELNQGSASDVDPTFAEEYADTENLQINPSISLGGIKNFTPNVAIGVWLARAQRSPSLAERYINKFTIGQDPYEMLGNPNLNPEVNNQLDLTLNWKTLTSSLDIDVFASYLQDYISSFIDENLSPIIPSSPGVRRFTNINEAIKYGAEINFTQNIYKSLTHNVGLAYTFGQDLERDEALPEIAPLDVRYQVQYGFANNKVIPSLSFRHVIQQNRISAEFGETKTPGFTLLDFDLSFNVWDNLNFDLGVQNIFDVSYYEHLSRSTATANQSPLFAPGRNFYAAFNYSFK